MWTFLSFLVCSTANVCFVTVPYDTPLAGISACEQQGMMIAPVWQEQHPGYTVKRIRCTIGKRPHGEDAV